MGEEPFLTAELATAQIKSLQYGYQPNGKNYLEVLATCKHFDVHGGPESIPSNRFSFNSVISKRDWVEMHQPAFEACVKAGVTAVMCSYVS